MDLSVLNDMQRASVEALEGPVMCIAGAGTGKTKTLTFRLAYMLDKGIDSHNILAVTFTNKAAKEMKERVIALTNSENDFNIFTFHSFAVRILRQNLKRANLGYTNLFHICDDEESASLIKKIMKEKHEDYLQIPDLKVARIQECISKQKNDSTLSTASLFAFPDFQFVYEDVKSEYNARLLSDNAMDFDDLINNAIKVLEIDSIRHYYNNLYNYIMVDEFQDTNEAQYRLLRLLTEKTQNVFIVGDQDQSIYAFRGAKVGNITDFMRDYPNYKMFKLERNYRSVENILHLSNSVINEDKKRIKKTLYSKVDSKFEPFFIKNYDNQDQVKNIVDIVKNVPKDKTVAILYRNNYMAREIEQGLIDASVKYVIYGGISFFQRKEIKDVLAYLRLIVDSNDNMSFRRVINFPARKIGDKTVDAIENDAFFKDISLFETIKDENAPYYKKTKPFLDVIDDFKNRIVYNQSITNIVSYIIEKLDLENEYEEDKLKNLCELSAIIKEFQDKYLDIEDLFERLAYIIQDLSLYTNQEQQDENDVNVILSTVHQSKGLEFDIVIVANVDDLTFDVTDEECQDEERRILYVAITRAKEMLFLSRASSRVRFGQWCSTNDSKLVQKSLYLTKYYNKSDLRNIIEHFKHEQKIKAIANIKV